jgi:hypothetical protein
MDEFADFTDVTLWQKNYPHAKAMDQMEATISQH